MKNDLTTMFNYLTYGYRKLKVKMQKADPLHSLVIFKLNANYRKFSDS